jgi:hypothetical protein
MLTKQPSVIDMRAFGDYLNVRNSASVFSDAQK